MCIRDRFCNKCGNKIIEHAKFCSKCGQAVNLATNNDVSHDNNEVFTLTINRAKQWFVVNPAVKIVVDGSTEYKIDNGATLDIPILAGVHKVAFSCSIRNKIVNINVSNNITLNIKWNRVTGSLEVE